MTSTRTRGGWSSAAPRRVAVAVNLGDTTQDVPVADIGDVLMAWPPDAVTTGASGVRLPADGVAVLARG